MIISLGLDSTERALLVVMAYDCYVAICNLLRFPITMKRVLCVHVADHRLFELLSANSIDNGSSCLR